jgi:hypothetical protein
MPWLLVTRTVVTESRITLGERGIGWECDVYGEGPAGVVVVFRVCGVRQGPIGVLAKTLF